MSYENPTPQEETGPEEYPTGEDYLKEQNSHTGNLEIRPVNDAVITAGDSSKVKLYFWESGNVTWEPLD